MAIVGSGLGLMSGFGGAVAGAGIGAGASLFDSQSKKKQAEKDRKRQEEATQSIPGRTRASRVYDAFREAQQQKIANMASLSQAAMDWAQMQR